MVKYGKLTWSNIYKPDACGPASSTQPCRQEPCPCWAYAATLSAGPAQLCWKHPACRTCRPLSVELLGVTISFRSTPWPSSAKGLWMMQRPKTTKQTIVEPQTKQGTKWVSDWPWLTMIKYDYNHDSQTKTIELPWNQMEPVKSSMRVRPEHLLSRSSSIAQMNITRCDAMHSLH